MDRSVMTRSMAFRFPLFLSLLIAAAGLAAACGSTTAPDAAVDRQVVIAAGETLRVSDADVAITFEGVSGDSRCPGDAICIQGGDAIVRVSVDGLGRRATHELHTGDTRVSARHESLTIRLVDLQPYPFGSLPPIKPGDYRVTLRVTR
jgi:hypothetical protein